MAQNLTYTQCGDYFIPDIRLAHTEAQILGKYGRMRRIFLEQNKPILFNDMILNETLFLHLWEVQQTCVKRMELLMEELLANNPAPDKATSAFTPIRTSKITESAPMGGGLAFNCLWVRIYFASLPYLEHSMEIIVPAMAKQEDVTEALKAANQMEWVRRMNSIRNRAEEIVLTELVYE